jgi:hypothetical protein
VEVLLVAEFVAAVPMVLLEDQRGVQVEVQQGMVELLVPDPHLEEWQPKEKLRQEVAAYPEVDDRRLEYRGRQVVAEEPAAFQLSSAREYASAPQSLWGKAYEYRCQIG